MEGSFESRLEINPETRTHIAEVGSENERCPNSAGY